MTDNRTTELRISEPLRGFIRHQSNRAYIDGGQARWLTKIADEIDAKYEQTIAVTLGSGTLTAEQVREAIERNFGKVAVIDDGGEKVEWREGWVCNVGFNSQAIADELNAELGSGTCEVECFDDGTDEGMDGEWFSYAPPTWYLSCGHTAQGTEKPNFCPVCGKVVTR